jgi:hypothetical protein
VVFKRRLLLSVKLAAGKGSRSHLHHHQAGWDRVVVFSSTRSSLRCSYKPNFLRSTAPQSAAHCSGVDVADRPMSGDNSTLFRAVALGLRSRCAVVPLCRCAVFVDLSVVTLRTREICWNCFSARFGFIVFCLAAPWSVGTDCGDQNCGLRTIEIEPRAIRTIFLHDRAGLTAERQDDVRNTRVAM